MIITVATRNQVNANSKKYIVSGATETDTAMLGIKDGDEIFVTEIGPAGQDDVEDEKAIAHLNPVYFSYSVEQVVKQLELVEA